MSGEASIGSFDVSDLNDGWHISAWSADGDEISLEEGDETVASMNINEWMEGNGYVIVDNGDERLEPSSGGDGESVNSRTQF